MTPPDPWFGRIIEDEKRFAPQPCKVVELWQHVNGDVSSRIETLQPGEIEGWVTEKGDTWGRPVDSVGGLRLIVAPAQLLSYGSLKWPFSRDTFKMLFTDFDLLTTVPIGFQGHLVKPAWVCRQLSHAASLSYHIETNTVKGVVFAEALAAESLALEPLINSIMAFKAWACHPMLVPLIVLIHEMDRLVDRRERDNLRTLSLEKSIGLRRDWTTDEDFLGKTEDAMRQTLEHLTMVTNHKADTEMLNRNFMDTIARSIELVDQQTPSIPDEASRKRMAQQSLDVEYLVESLRQSNISIAASFGALQKRVEIQMSALYTLVGQRDSKLNLEMAYDSRRLASASKRDSSSMKTIAVLTTVFLPGTFIATVFSMPMVDYAPAQFWIYLAIAIPLTLLVLAVWATWMLWIERRNEREDKKAEERLPIYDSREEYGLIKIPALRRLNRVLCQD